MWRLHRYKKKKKKKKEKKKANRITDEIKLFMKGVVPFPENLLNVQFACDHKTGDECL